MRLENKKLPQGLLYFFRVLDFKKQGYLDVEVINYFFREVIKTMLKENYNNNPQQYINEGDVVQIEDVINEIFDMVSPEHPYRITYEDLLRCGVGHTVVTLLTDYRGFLVYENRENIIAEEVKQDIEQQEQQQLLQQQQQQLQQSQQHLQQQQQQPYQYQQQYAEAYDNEFAFRHQQHLHEGAV